MKLSKRLELIKSLVTRGNKVADIGTDHAHIPISLVLDRISPSVIAMDIGKGPLLKAEENISLYNLENRIITRLSDGLDKLEEKEVDTIIIAGMGADLIVDILSKASRLKKDIKEYILSPHSQWEKLRKFLRENSYKIIEEKMLIDEEKYYLVIKVVPELDNIYLGYSKEDLYIYDMYGKILLDNKDEVLKEYLLKELRAISKVLKEFENFDVRFLKDKTKFRFEEVKVKEDNIKKILESIYQYES